MATTKGNHFGLALGTVDHKAVGKGEIGEPDRHFGQSRHQRFVLIQGGFGALACHPFGRGNLLLQQGKRFCRLGTALT